MLFFGIAGKIKADHLQKKQMKLSLLYFAQLRESIGMDSEELEFPSSTVGAQLIATLVAKYPQITEVSGSIQLAVNGEYQRLDVVIPDAAEVALIPPVSGG